MASTTKTTTYAQAGYQAPANAFGNRQYGTVSGGALASLSASACAVLLLCKLPVGASNVRLAFQALHTGATGAKLQFGIKGDDGAGAASVTASALLTLTDIDVTNRTAWIVGRAVDLNWSASYNSHYKYVQCSVGSGTVSAGFVLDWEVLYDMQGKNS